MAFAYVGAGTRFQRSLLFPRPPVPALSSRPANAQQVWLSTPDGPVESWYLPPIEPQIHPSPLMIVFHGNSELIDDLPQEFAQPRRWGLAVLLVEFPGYGRSSGAPSQPSVTATALAAYDWSAVQTTIDPSRVVAYGRSLGGAAAAILASKRSLAALVLESTFTSVRTFAHRFWLPEFVVRDPFDTIALLTGYGRPTLILHGDRDELVPPHHAEQLAHAADHARLQFLPCGHNDCSRPWQLVRTFLSDARVLAH
jgi:fermentation-respiration switch protein FrsA (DUF1100 family)